jgi:hypothetical protein
MPFENEIAQGAEGQRSARTFVERRSDCKQIQALISLTEQNRPKRKEKAENSRPVTISISSIPRGGSD